MNGHIYIYKRILILFTRSRKEGVCRNAVKWNASKSSFKTRRRDLLQLVTVAKGGWEADHALFCQSLDIYSPGCAGHATHARVHACATLARRGG